MKHISILVPEGQNNLSSIVGAYKILSRANTRWHESRGVTPYTIELAGLSEEVAFHDGLFTARPHRLIRNIAKTNLIIIPSLNHQFELAVAANGTLIDWIKNQYKGGAEVASICTGAFLLASAGLLSGKKCATHWAFADEFRCRFPEVDLQADRVITHEDGLYTNGGAYSFLNLILYLVEKYFDRETAIFCSKIFQIETDRPSQSSFILFKGQKRHADDAVKKAQAFIEDNLHQKISIGELSSRLAVGRRNFDRRFLKATGNSPLEYLQRVRIEAAKKSFETSRKAIGDVMYEVGYSDAKAFRTVFKKLTGLSPLQYRERYSAFLPAV